MTPTFDDALVTPTPSGAGEGFFNRFYFNGHGADVFPYFMVGVGLHPVIGVADSYLMLVTEDGQHNFRYSTTLESATTKVGFVSWGVNEAFKHWTFAAELLSHDVAIEAEYLARLKPIHYGLVEFSDGQGGSTRFDHYVQAGFLRGSARLAGKQVSLDGFYSMRDRSFGERLVHARKGVHLWAQPQFEDCQVSLMFDEDRTGREQSIYGAVAHSDGRIDRIESVRHDLRFDRALELREAIIEVGTEQGESFLLSAELPPHGGYLQGGGYDGWHGKNRGPDHFEQEYWPHGSVSPATLRTPITDRVARFRLGDEIGFGILEFGHSRSSEYQYRPTLSPRN